MDKKYAIGNFIYELRQRKGLTQKQLGDMVGVTNKAVSKWETGAALPRIEYLRAIAAALGCTEEELFLGRLSESDATETVVTAQASYTSVVQRCDSCRHEPKTEKLGFLKRRLVCKQCGAELKYGEGWIICVAAVTALFNGVASIIELMAYYHFGIDRIFANGFATAEEAAFFRELHEHFPKLETIGSLATGFLILICRGAVLALVFLFIFLMRKRIKYRILRYPHAEDGKIVF